MARYTGSTCKLARRCGTDIGAKSRVRDVSSKCNLQKVPGQHGDKRARRSEYGVQLLAKQLVKYVYGVLEKQFRRYYKEASRLAGSTGELLLQLLESRLDNVVYRCGFGRTRAESRQLVRHKAITVNGAIVTIPSYKIVPGDTIAVREKSKIQERIKDSLKLAEDAVFPEWVAVDVAAMQAEFKRLPDRSELPAEFNEQLIVELYSKF